VYSQPPLKLHLHSNSNLKSILRRRKNTLSSEVLTSGGEWGGGGGGALFFEEKHKNLQTWDLRRKCMLQTWDMLIFVFSLSGLEKKVRANFSRDEIVAGDTAGSQPET
jgi:hypothetical protein